MPLPQNPTTKVSSSKPIVNIAAYKFVALDNLPQLRASLKSTGIRLGLKGTILLSSEGINLFLAGSRVKIDQFLGELRSDARFVDIEVKESYTEDQPFRRMLVKIKREIIPCDDESVVPERYTSQKVSPREFHQWLAQGRDLTLLDVRNDYEVRLGTFRNAKELGIRHFRQFEEAARRLPDDDKRRPMVMFCTGGIRCEKAGPLIERLGFDNVFQLEGGILRYFEECGGDFYDGSCFVFDHRVAVDPDLKPTGIAHCFACQATLTLEDQQSDQYVEGESCPYCFVPKDERLKRERERHQAALHAIAESQPGTTPYDNRLLIHVPRCHAGLHAIDFLARMFPNTSFEYWKHKLDAGLLLNDRGPLSPDQVVREGERIVHVEPNTIEPAVAANIEVIYEDSELIVLAKPAPLPVHPCGRYNRNTLQHFLNHAYYPDKVRFPHRLDSLTTGVLVALRRRSAAQAFQKLQLQGKVCRTYLAKVAIQPSEQEWVVDVPIAQAPSEFGSRQLEDAGKSARTRFRYLRTTSDGNYLLEAIPETGRTHQIRVHLWHSGMPVINDPLYRVHREIGSMDGELNNSVPIGLHAWRISFPHWDSGEVHTFEAESPREFA